MTMLPSSHHQNLSRQKLQFHGGCGGADYYYHNNRDESFGGLLMNQVEEGGYDLTHLHPNPVKSVINNNRYSYYNNNNNTSIDKSYLLASSSDLALVNGPIMAEEDESRTTSLNNNEAEEGSSSKSHHHVDHEDHNKDERWLQLSIGSNIASPEIRARSLIRGSSSASRLIELDLLPGNNIASPSSSSSSRQFQFQQAARASTMSRISPMFHVPDHHQVRVPNFGMSNLSNTTTSSSLYFQAPPSFAQHQQHQEVNWGFRPLMPHHPHPRNNHVGISSHHGSTSTSSFVQMGPSSSSSTSYFARPFQFQHHQFLHGGVSVAPTTMSLDFRVVDPPRRPHSGIWFTLQASQNQDKEPFLPQIPKSYLRIKDGRMTIRLIKKYLVNKLSLDSESEVEITCKGQQLLPFVTMQHVRDSIWSLREAASLALLPLPDFSTSTADDHVMVLHYARTTSSSTSTTA